MLGFKKRGPDKAFSHTDDCKTLAADATVSIEWSEVEPAQTLPSDVRLVCDNVRMYTER